MLVQACSPQINLVLQQQRYEFRKHDNVIELALYDGFGATLPCFLLDFVSKIVATTGI
jgi:hypothetical protein